MEYTLKPRPASPVPATEAVATADPLVLEKESA